MYTGNGLKVTSSRAATVPVLLLDTEKTHPFSISVIKMAFKVEGFFFIPKTGKGSSVG